MQKQNLKISQPRSREQPNVLFHKSPMARGRRVYPVSKLCISMHSYRDINSACIVVRVVVHILHIGHLASQVWQISNKEADRGRGRFKEIMTMRLMRFIMRGPTPISCSGGQPLHEKSLPHTAERML